MSLPNRSRRWMFVAGMLCVFAPSHLAAGISSQETAQRSREIEQMTAIERDRLQRNWNTFLALPLDRRQHFRQLHQHLENDRKTSNGQLQETLQTYALWLQTLNPGQRADLRAAKDPLQKLELVKKFKDEQERRQESRVLDDPAYDPSQLRDAFSLGWKKPRQGDKPLTSQELRSAIQALVDELPRPEQDELEKIDTSRDKWSFYRQVVERSVRQADGARDWPTPQQQLALATAIKSSGQVERLEKIEKESLRRVMFAKLMGFSLAVEMARDSAPFQPKKGDLEDIFGRLDHTEREQLMQLPAEEMAQALLRKFQNQNKDPAYLEFAKQRRDFQETTKKLLREAQRGGGRFGGPPGGNDRMQFRPNGPPPGRFPSGGPEENGDPNRPPRDRRPPPPNRAKD